MARRERSDTVCNRAAMMLTLTLTVLNAREIIMAPRERSVTVCNKFAVMLTLTLSDLY